jgi:Ser/Thr protein kinase RdoA (MazF antagonist)
MLDPNLNRIAKLFGIEVQSAFQASGGFSEASVFRVMCTDNRAFAVRKTPVAAALPETRLRVLHRLLRVVRDQGIAAVPVPLEPLRSPLLETKETNEIQCEESWVRQGADLWQAETWLPGAPADGRLTDEQLSSALECLHAFHTAARTAVFKVMPNEWFCLNTGVSPGIQRRLTIANELSSGLLKSLKAAAERDSDPQFRALSVRICQAIAPRLPRLLTQLTQLSHQTFALQPVVRDLWRAHVLFTGNQVTGLIDFSAAASDHVCLDLSRLLRSWFRSDVQRIRSAAERFSTQRRLSPIEWALLNTLDAATVLLSPVTWLRRRLESGDQSRCRDDVFVRLTELTEIAEQFRPLLDSDKSAGGR